MAEAASLFSPCHAGACSKRLRHIDWQQRKEQWRGRESLTYTLAVRGALLTELRWSCEAREIEGGRKPRVP